VLLEQHLAGFVEVDFVAELTFSLLFFTLSSLQLFAIWEAMALILLWVWAQASLPDS